MFDNDTNGTYKIKKYQHTIYTTKFNPHIN